VAAVEGGECLVRVGEGIPDVRRSKPGSQYMGSVCMGFQSNRREVSDRLRGATDEGTLPLYHLPLMTMLVMLMFSINPMIYVLD
jgi:hypothetical protein